MFENHDFLYFQGVREEFEPEDISAAEAWMKVADDKSNSLFKISQMFFINLINCYGLIKLKASTMCDLIKANDDFILNKN